MRQSLLFLVTEAISRPRGSAPIWTPWQPCDHLAGTRGRGCASRSVSHRGRPRKHRAAGRSEWSVARLFQRSDLTGRALREIAIDPLPAQKLYRTGDMARRLPDGQIQLSGAPISRGK